MVNAFKISSKTVHHEDKQVFVCNCLYGHIHLHVYIWNKNTHNNIYPWYCGFIINYKIKKSFLKAYYGSNPIILRIIMQTQAILK